MFNCGQETKPKLIEQLNINCKLFLISHFMFKEREREREDISIEVL